MHNLFCDHNDLRNEADVEQIFARHLIEEFGYSDKAIRPKTAQEGCSAASATYTNTFGSCPSRSTI